MIKLLSLTIYFATSIFFVKFFVYKTFRQNDKIAKLWFALWFFRPFDENFKNFSPPFISRKNCFHEMFAKKCVRINSQCTCGNCRNSLKLKKISSNQLLSDFFSKFIAFTKFLGKKCEREFLQFPHNKIREFSHM